MPDEPHQQPETDVRESDPNASGPQGLTGDMGLSSERTGPGGSAPADSGVQSTGTHGSAARDTYGVSNTGSDEDLAAAEDEATAVEANPAEVPPHEFDPTKNPGHSHGS